MIPGSRYKGILSFDAMFSILPMVLMFSFLIQILYFTGETNHQQEKFDKLVSIADYTVKIGAVRSEEKIRYPNWIEENKLTVSYIDDLQERMKLDSLHIGFVPGEGLTCIYRLVVTGEDKKISKLFVCG
ncbi:hypothetical protein JXA56_02545 [Candidatus Micrarchaeota archaeon]|nr:hypothetical protein [Candidatus Micrarchaeota archaeon]